MMDWFVRIRSNKCVFPPRNLEFSENSHTGTTLCHHTWRYYASSKNSVSWMAGGQSVEMMSNGIFPMKRLFWSEYLDHLKIKKYIQTSCNATNRVFWYYGLCLEIIRTYIASCSFIPVGSKLNRTGHSQRLFNNFNQDLVKKKLSTPKSYMKYMSMYILKMLTRSPYTQSELVVPRWHFISIKVLTVNILIIISIS